MAIDRVQWSTKEERKTEIRISIRFAQDGITKVCNLSSRPDLTDTRAHAASVAYPERIRRLPPGAISPIASRYAMKSNGDAVGDMKKKPHL